MVIIVAILLLALSFATVLHWLVSRRGPDSMWLLATGWAVVLAGIGSWHWSTQLNRETPLSAYLLAAFAGPLAAAFTYSAERPSGIVSHLKVSGVYAFATWGGIVFGTFFLALGW